MRGLWGIRNRRRLWGGDVIVVYALGLFAAAVYLAAVPRAYGEAGADGDDDLTLRRDAADGAAPRTLDLERIDPSTFARRAGGVSAKDVIEASLALALLIVLAPLMAATALAVRLDSPGPALYRQRRVGLGGRVFEVLKFRSMSVDAEAEGPQYARPDDRRATRVGRFIRQFHIDEAPQLVNVLRGDMSFIGPRPERPEFTGLLARALPHYNCRHLVKPGITGWAQVHCQYAASVEEARVKLAYDLYYLRHRSPALDFVILAKTARVALFGLGAAGRPSGGNRLHD